MKASLGLALDTCLVVLVAVLAFGPEGAFRPRIDDWVHSRSVLERARGDWVRITGHEASKLANGTRGGPVVVVFGDYRCPFCAVAQPALDSLLAAYPSVNAIYRHAPAGHRARAAAVAAVCADEQGRFAEMHRRLMATEIWADTTQAPWREMARNAGVPDQKGFDACLESVRAHARVDVDVLLAGRIGIAGTPTFLTRDRVLEGPQSVASLTSALELETRR